jgi:hypothetical protein
MAFRQVRSKSTATNDVSYTHIFNRHYENLVHTLISQEFYDRDPQRIAEVSNLRYFNEHLFDIQLNRPSRSHRL